MTGVGSRDKPVRVLIVADDTLTRMGLASLLEGLAAVEVAGQIGDVGELEVAVDAFRPEVILWDAARAESESSPVAFADVLPPVLALRARNDIVTTFWASGVRGVIDREAGGAQMEAAILAVARGLVVSLPGELPRTPGAASRPASSNVEPLTPREIEVLQLLAEGMANKEIARHLGLSENTVKFHVNSILGKLGATSRTDAVVRATRAGLLLL